jgi:hypothetical protein
MQKKKLFVLAALILILLTGSLFIILTLQNRRTASVDPKNRLTSFESITFGIGCEPQKNQIVLHGDGRIENSYAAENVRLSKSQISILLSAINDADYFSLTDAKAGYYIVASDTSSVLTKVIAEGKENKIQHIVGCLPDESAAKECARMTAFEKTVSKVIDDVALSLPARKMWKEKSYSGCF